MVRNATESAAIERLGRGRGNCPGRRIGQRPTDQLDRLTGNFGKASGEPRMLQGRNGCTQRLKVVFLHFYLGIFQG